MILSVEVERMYSKDQILDLYLNESPYGGRRNGVESAAQTYFGKSAKDLSLAESALLAAIPNQPGLYDPYNIAGHDALIDRQHKVLDNMVDLKYITQAQADAAKQEPILDSIKPLSDQLSNIKAPHFVLMVRQQLEQALGKTTVGNGGLNVTTTLDLNIQNKLEEQMTDMFNSSQPRAAGFTNGAAVVEDVQTPDTGTAGQPRLQLSWIRSRQRSNGVYPAWIFDQAACIRAALPKSRPRQTKLRLGFDTCRLAD